VVSFRELFERRLAAASRLLALERELTTTLTDEEQAEYDAIFDPMLNRLSFDDFEGMPKESTSQLEAMPASCTVPSLANQLLWARARLGVCVGTCSCVCARCVYLRARARHTRWGADLT
jgi:hypothetical protein